jgi:APA family basic amino acid/polyamine antiporter
MDQNATTPAGGATTMARALLRTKALDTILADAEAPEVQLRRALGPVQVTLLGIGAIIGAGIFATIGTAAAGDQFRPGAGPALMLSFVITAVVCGFTALCYAEFASMVPTSGSAYTYSYATLGELLAWIIGWDLIIEYAVGNIAIAISWANYFKTLVAGFGVVVPDWLSMDYRTAAKVPGVYESAPHVFGVPIIVNVLAVGIVAAITLVLIWGIRESARLNAVMVGIKIIVLTFFVIVGAYWVRPGNWTPFAPNHWAGVNAGAAIVFFAYIGFDAVTTVAEETHDPHRNLPIGIIASLIICTVFYVVVAAVFTGLIPYPELRAALSTEQAEPLTLALQRASPHLGWAVGIVAFGSVVAHTAVLFVWQLGQPRILFSMARDGLLPPLFSRVHERFRTPHISTILTGVFVGGFAAVASLDEMVDLTNIGTLFAFILVCTGIIVLRVREPERPRPFRVPAGWGCSLALYVAFAIAVVLISTSAGQVAVELTLGAVLFILLRNYVFPVLGILSCSYLIWFLPPISWLRFAAWLNCGFVIYVSYGTLNSRLAQVDDVHAAHRDAHTAYTGAWLGIWATGALFATRGLDLWLEALRHHENLSGLHQAQAALAEVMRPQPWLAGSWFLIVPLTLTALVLCPTVISRARRAAAQAPGEDVVRIARAARALAAGLAAAGLAYLACVVAIGV